MPTFTVHSDTSFKVKPTSTPLMTIPFTRAFHPLLSLAEHGGPIRIYDSWGRRVISLLPCFQVLFLLGYAASDPATTISPGAAGGPGLYNYVATVPILLTTLIASLQVLPLIVLYPLENFGGTPQYITTTTTGSPVAVTLAAVHSIIVVGGDWQTAPGAVGAASDLLTPGLYGTDEVLANYDVVTTAGGTTSVTLITP